MPAAYRHPTHFTAPVNTNYQTNYEAINFKKTNMANEAQNEKDSTVTSGEATQADVTVAKKRGRPKGSKNKAKDTTAEKVAAPATSPVVQAPGAPPAAGAPVTTVQHPVHHPDHATGVQHKVALKTVDVPGTAQPAASTSANPSAGSTVVAPTAVVRVPVPETPEEKQERLEKEADEQLAQAEEKAKADETRAHEILAAQNKHNQAQSAAVKPHPHTNAHKHEPKDQD